MINIKLMSSTNSTMVHARMDPKLKKAVEKILKRLGISFAEAIRMYFAQIANRKAIPFTLDLETDDVQENYIRVKDEAHLKRLIGLD